MPFVETLPEEAAALKEQGNEQFKNGQYLKAAALFTKALKSAPESATLYSNRAAAFRALNKLNRSVEDARECVKLAPQWSKGYYRLGLAYQSLEEPEKALEALQKGKEVDAASKEIQLKIAEVSRLVEERQKKQKIGALRKNFEPSAAPSDQYLREVIEAVKRSTEEADVLFYFADLSAIGIKGAFDSPEMLTKCVEHLRAEVKQKGSSMACMVVRKRAVQYPQVWADKAWAFGNEDGYLVQLHSAKRAEQRVLFLAGIEDGLTAYDLDFNNFRFMPDVIVESFG